MNVKLVYAPCFHEENLGRIVHAGRYKWLNKPRTCPGCGKRRTVCEVHMRPVLKPNDSAAVS